MVFSLWNELIIRTLLKIHYSASYYSILAFVIRYTSTQAFHNWNRCVVARVAQWCPNLNWVNGKLHTKINTVQKQLTCLAPFASALPFLSPQPSWQCAPDAFRHLQVERAEAAIVVQQIHTDRHTSCSIQCIISLPLCSEWTCESINERISDIQQQHKQQQHSRCQLSQVVL